MSHNKCIGCHGRQHRAGNNPVVSCDNESNESFSKHDFGRLDKDVDATVKDAVRTLVNGFKLVTRIERRVLTEWNVDTPTSKSIYQWERTLKETGTLVSQTGKNP
ncbi:hypothetical protein TNCV_2183861 [Trichonephila clavipes]|nr:hypothetical protein TNCV_2183861 [Trichonephila clavipes]